MSILRDFERRLESAVEGAFAKTFRSGLQPVELAKRALRDMEAGRSIGVKNEMWAPNRFVFTLSPPDRENFAGAEAALVAELSQVVRSGASERGWSLMGPPQIELETGARLKKGVFKCDATIVEGTDPAAEAPAHLTSMAGERRGQAYPLSGAVTVLGRLDECEVVLTDPAASRRHAQVRNESGVFTLTDLGSTNGTLLNGAPVSEGILDEGDRITIGQTVLEFRRG